jgi:AraC-like DNA-binding protein
MYYIARPPAPALAPFVEAFWYCAVRPPYELERALPTGAMQILVNLHDDVLTTRADTDLGRVHRVGGAALQGPSARPAVIDTAEQRAIAGVSFRPGGAYPFFTAPSTETADRLVGLDDLWGVEGRLLGERLLDARDPADVLCRLEAVLLRRAVRPLSTDRGVAFAVAAFERGAAVTAVTERLGTTRQRFARRFGALVGLTPKRYARVRRFQRLVASVASGGPVDWAVRAAEFGYYDQAHMIHEFRGLAGISPTRYEPRSPVAPNHVPLETVSTMPADARRHIMAV